MSQQAQHTISQTAWVHTGEGLAGLGEVDGLALGLGEGLAGLGEVDGLALGLGEGLAGLGEVEGLGLVLGDREGLVVFVEGTGEAGVVLPEDENQGVRPTAPSIHCTLTHWMLVQASSTRPPVSPAQQ